MPEELNMLFRSQIRVLYSGESQLLIALPAMRASATDPALAETLSVMLNQAKEHIRFLAGICQQLQVQAIGEHCESMEGLISEIERYRSQDGKVPIKNAMLISGAQQISMLQVAGYNTARNYAEPLNLHDARRHLTGAREHAVV
ncbi:MAG: DUF892 family protein, partial [Verrucomicrobiota bacterium]